LLTVEYGSIFVWWLVLLALATAGVPIAATLFTSIPDRGVGLALPTALIAFVLPAYWVGQLWFGQPALVAGVIALGTLSVGGYARPLGTGTSIRRGVYRILTRVHPSGRDSRSRSIDPPGWR
jgi:hypothetical protein